MSKVRTLEMNPTRGRSLRPFPRGTARYVSGTLVVSLYSRHASYDRLIRPARDRRDPGGRRGGPGPRLSRGARDRMAAGQAEKAVRHNFAFPRLTAERFPAAHTLRANLAQPHRAAGPSLPGSAGVRPREAPGLIIPARARSCRLASPGHCRRVDQCHAGFFCTCRLYSLSRVDAGQESTQGRRRQTQTRDAAVNRSTISGLIDQAVAQYAREIGVQDAPPGRTA